jgi:hypothetical protein
MDRKAFTEAFDRATGPVLDLLRPDQARRIADFHGDERLQDRIAELARRSTEGELTDEERSEYEGYAQANRFLAVLQAKARRLVAA